MSHEQESGRHAPEAAPLHSTVAFEASPGMHHAATGRDDCRMPRYLREDRLRRLVKQRDATDSEREALGENSEPKLMHRMACGPSWGFSTKKWPQCALRLHAYARRVTHEG